MDIDFEFYFVIAVVITGIFYFCDKRWLAPARKAAGIEKQPIWLEYTSGLFWPLVAVLIIRSFIFQFVLVPTSSLAPTIVPSELLFVQEYAYGLRLPIIHTKILDIAEPTVGDLAVFHWPVDPDIYFVKRVIGTPGDHIHYHNKQLTVNGKVAKLSEEDVMQDPDTRQPMFVTVKTEQLGKAKHQILQRDYIAAKDFDITVPEGQYFMMGDNRDNSNDSRDWGLVPEKNIVGKPMYVMISWDTFHNRIRWERFGVKL